MSFLLPNQIKYKPKGNTDADVLKLRREYGSNSFTESGRKSFFKQYLSAFGDPIIKILLIALALNVLIAIKSHEIYEPLGIGVALFLATFVSTLSEYGSESAFIKLKEQASATTCRVMRNGKLILIPSDELVVNDTVYLSAGERVPADSIIVSGSVMADNSALNGESTEVSRCAANPPDEWKLEDSGLLFMGAVITSGDCIVSVGRTGDNTFYGNVAVEVQADTGRSPLTERLYKLASVLGKIGYGAAVLVLVADLFNSIVLDNGFNTVRIISEIKSLPIMASNLLHAITLAITVVVVAIPEGLPMMITVVLSSNMKRLKKDNVLVRKLVGIETGGALNILFCDKTGTLTNGKLTVTGFYDVYGRFTKGIPALIKEDVLCCTVLGNDSFMIGKKASGGNATDRALLEYAYDKKYDSVMISKKIPFDSTKKYSAICCRGMWYIKGAPEVIFKNCESVSNEIITCHKNLTKNGARVIALAKSRDMKRYQLIGLISIADNIRRDARYSVNEVQNAGISVCMVTGDNADTALSIAASCGILTKDAITLTSEELSRLSDAELSGILPRLKVVSRALPTDKSRLVRVSRESGLVCGMTGDGINDAPALRQADVGFAMGSGTEVAKQAGDIVILDDNFSSISKAILYGRTIFKSIRKFIVFQLTMNLCAVGISVIGPFIGIDTPVTVMQMLWINIIMDTLAGLAFAGEPPLSCYMNEQPLSRTEHVLNKKMGTQITAFGVYNIVLCFMFLWSEYFKSRFFFYTDNIAFMTAFFTLFIFSGVFGGVCARSDGANILRGLSRNRAFIVIFILISAVSIWLIYFGGEMFRTTPIPIFKLVSIILLSATTLPFGIMVKLITAKSITD